MHGAALLPPYVQSQGGWDAVARAAANAAASLKMNAQDVAVTLNALSKLDRAAEAMPPSGWDDLAAAAEKAAKTMNSQEVSMTLNGASKLRAAAEAGGVFSHTTRFHSQLKGLIEGGTRAFLLICHGKTVERRLNGCVNRLWGPGMRRCRARRRGGRRWRGRRNARRGQYIHV